MFRGKRAAFCASTAGAEAQKQEALLSSHETVLRLEILRYQLIEVPSSKSCSLDETASLRILLFLLPSLRTLWLPI